MVPKYTRIQLINAVLGIVYTSHSSHVMCGLSIMHNLLAITTLSSFRGVNMYDYKFHCYKKTLELKPLKPIFQTTKCWHKHVCTICYIPYTINYDTTNNKIAVSDSQCL